MTNLSFLNERKNACAYDPILRIMATKYYYSTSIFFHSLKSVWKGLLKFALAQLQLLSGEVMVCANRLLHTV